MHKNPTKIDEFQMDLKIHDLYTLIKADIFTVYAILKLIFSLNKGNIS